MKVRNCKCHPESLFGVAFGCGIFSLYTQLQGPGSLPSGVPTEPPLKVFIYQLNDSFRDEGRGCNLLQRDCAFGGPVEHRDGIEIWNSGQFEWPRMIYYRLQHATYRTKSVKDADVFFIPAFRTGLEAKCSDKEAVLAAVFSQNPLLAGPQMEAVAKRHFFIDSRAGWGEEMCAYMWSDQGAPRFFKRVVLEIGDWAPQHPVADYTYGRPWKWLAFPYPSFYHGPVAQLPARQRKRGPAKVLWSFFGTGRGAAAGLRHALKQECAAVGRKICFEPREPSSTHYDAATMKDMTIQEDPDMMRRSLHSFMNATFCAQPPGDTISRKGIVDSIISGCIPVVFVPQQLNIWETHLTKQEFESMAVFVPEIFILGTQNKEDPPSLWAKLNLGVKTEYEEDEVSPAKFAHAWESLGYNSPPWASFLENASYQVPHRLTQVLQRISEAEIRRKQDLLATYAWRLHLGYAEEQDALTLLLNRISKG